MLLIVCEGGRFGSRANCDDARDAGSDLTLNQFFQCGKIDRAVAKRRYYCSESASEHSSDFHRAFERELSRSGQGHACKFIPVSFEIDAQLAATLHNDVDR